jgi:hypothetical protein
MQHHAADQLHIEMALADGALRRLADRGEGFGEEILELLALLDPGAEGVGAGA